MIPKRIFYFWDGPLPCPPNPQQWAQMHPGWEIIKLNSADVHHPQRDWLVDECAWASLSDAARVRSMAMHGGVFLDVDFTLHLPLDSLLDKAFVCVEGATSIANGLLGAEAGNPFFVEYHRRIQEYDLVELSRQGIPNVAGPVLCSSLWREMCGPWPEDTVCEKGHDSPEFPVRILPKRFFFPYSWNEAPCPPAPDSHGTHEWKARWKHNDP